MFILIDFDVDMNIQISIDIDKYNEFDIQINLVENENKIFDNLITCSICYPTLIGSKPNIEADSSLYRCAIRRIECVDDFTSHLIGVVCCISVSTMLNFGNHHLLWTFSQYSTNIRVFTDVRTHH